MRSLRSYKQLIRSIFITQVSPANMAAGTPFQLAKFVSEARFSDMPSPIVEQGKRHVLDTLGAGLVGATSIEAKRTLDVLRASDGNGPSSVWGTDQKLSPRNAALVNGTAAHAFELDDTGGCDHSGAVVLPAALAALDLTQRQVSGGEFLLAVVLGYDISRRVLEGFGGYAAHNEPGWHSTGTCGTFGAAAAAARILNLDTDKTAAAISTSASFSSGIWAFIHDGAMTKRLHAGRAAEGGLLAAQLANGGLTGPAHVFDDVWGGFFKTLGHRPGKPDAVLKDLGSDWRLRNAAIKPYASCRDTHSAVDAVRRILARSPITPDDVGALEVRVNEFLNGMVGGRTFATLPAAQMSLPYAVSAAIVLRTNGLSAYSEANRRDPRLASMVERVAMKLDPTVESSSHSSVTMVLKDGTRLEEATSIPLGAPENPVSDKDLIAKFDELAEVVISRDASKTLANALLSIESVDDVRTLLPLLHRSR